MRLIVDSSSTRTEWALVEGSEMVEHAFTTGLNPYFQTRREISHAIRLELPDTFFRRRWEHVHFYGAGCATPSRNKIVEASLVAQFKTPVTVNSDLVGAARGLLIHQPGIVCILANGSNACYYDGQELTQAVPSMGFILGDEGSSAQLGRRLVNAVYKRTAPAHIVDAFTAQYPAGLGEVMEKVYSASMPALALSEYSLFLSERQDDPWVSQLVYDAFMTFLRRNVSHYDWQHHPLSIEGSTAVLYRDILAKACRDFGAEIRSIESHVLPGLIAYHSSL